MYPCLSDDRNTLVSNVKRNDFKIFTLFDVSFVFSRGKRTFLKPIKILILVQLRLQEMFVAEWLIS